MIDSTTVAPDAAIALGIASTAMPFARTPEDEAERWLRVLRLHGEAGAALQALGVSEGRLGEPAHAAAVERASKAGEQRADPVERVIDEAVRIAARRGCPGVATTDLLLAVMCVYGEDFDSVLQAHGTDRDELMQRLGVELGSSEVCA
ncbi:MAG TPA: hypothetical protein VFW38_06280 [Solirubrobacteraceae bacterium]|nr:hypothetical protein [Solirubrobacteraceae bacterium]